MIASSNFAEP